MAFLIDGVNLDGHLSLDMFYPESFRVLDELIIVPDEKIIVVRELWSGKSCDTFFKLDTLERIDPFKRYKQENGRAYIERKADLTVITMVNVEQDTMMEYLLGAIFRDDQQIFKSFDTRYSNEQRESTYQQYLNLQAESSLLKKSRESFFVEFTNMSFGKKVGYLRKIFRYNFRMNCEVGNFPPERFLSQELFDMFDQDKQFRNVLWEVLKLEEELSLDQAADEVYNDLIQHYLTAG